MTFTQKPVAEKSVTTRSFFRFINPLAVSSTGHLRRRLSCRRDPFGEGLGPKALGFGTMPALAFHLPPAFYRFLRPSTTGHGRL
ncbi:hypothetical protein CDAR_457591 [Caerostris darwini]|uniref:Uncharacterized protein n=1 Tax=Caerostris darwini TaxID=1538125 RepID=A0AAV4M6X9_9ARAC|nr:hypothetical protein CDAR_457591 [Caerostris darwini]